MFRKLEKTDDILQKGSLFSKAEVQYNLIHRMVEHEVAFCLRTHEGDGIFTHIQGQNGWLWIDKDASLDRKCMIIHELINRIGELRLAGISAHPEIAALFAESYANVHAVSYRNSMEMEAFECPKVIKPSGIDGLLINATNSHTEVVGNFLTAFRIESLDSSRGSSNMHEIAKKGINSGKVYLWTLHGTPVSMATITHRSKKHARINSVYTPKKQRGKGHASALVAELCSIIEAEGLVPMLYTDLTNPTSNKIYKRIGFVERGKISDVGFIQ